MNKHLSVALAIVYIVSFLAGLFYLGYILSSTNLFQENYKLLLGCMTVGGIGGALYCLRGIYLNYSVYKNWGTGWLVWYLCRPIASLICGGVSYLFLRSGLLVLEASHEPDASNLGFYALAFIAGLNVDKFINKTEELALSTWGIKKTRTSQKSSESENSETQ